MLAIPELEIRRVLPLDMDSIVELENACFDDPYPRYFLEQLAVAHPDTFLVAVLDKTIVGYSVVDKWEDHDHLLSIAVSQEQRRKGVGQKLLSSLEATRGTQRPLRLEVRKSNNAAIQLYFENGFTVTGLEPGYYRDGEDALLMKREPREASSRNSNFDKRQSREIAP